MQNSIRRLGRRVASFLGFRKAVSIEVTYEVEMLSVPNESGYRMTGRDGWKDFDVAVDRIRKGTAIGRTYFNFRKRVTTHYDQTFELECALAAPPKPLPPRVLPDAIKGRSA